MSSVWVKPVGEGWLVFAQQTNLVSVVFPMGETCPTGGMQGYLWWYKELLFKHFQVTHLFLGFRCNKISTSHL